ncbi:hypothetical protein MX659_07605 [Coriobacteriia bacterium Es71-Z0120]|uniref:hypothetical protein n=1 Tax=Parvivirga hydrogeniphila TaxID=2939460 RepID=UPI002260EE38|nr:hypothetical protein [Parvivirga hydrogeniphila]MCL4079447.1 hypothetical protein [Parvivirga hydrogeniphila]
MRKTTLAAALAIGVAGSVAAVLLTPPDQKLGAMVRFVMYHGASTWVNMATFTIAGAAGVATLLGAERWRPYGEAFRWLALPHWVVNTILGLISMKLIWGGILWNEPRLLMTFGILAGALLVLAAQYLADSPKVPAALDALLALSLWALVLVLPNLFHPDSPVFRSGNTAYIATFLGMVASVAVAVLASGVAIARRKTETAA